MNQILNFISLNEIYAAIAGLLLGWAVTEPLKRIARFFVSRRQPPGLYPAIGCVVTGIVVYVLWPHHDAKFAHPLVAALTLGLLAPTIYKLVTAALRHFGLDWIANVLTGERRYRIQPPPGGVERRQS